jgi:hypothetical protein
MPHNRTCAKCLFWNMQTDSSGECHRYAPHAILWGTVSDERSKATFVFWPRTLASECCGDFSIQHN